jgi:hypothetical protein
MSKIIKLTESDIVKIVKKVLSEQEKNPLLFDRSQLYSDAESINVDIKPVYDKKTGKTIKPQSSAKRTIPTLPVSNLKNISNMIWNARDKSWDQSTSKTLFNDKISTDALAYALLSWVDKNKNFDEKLFIATISILLRESKGSAGTFLHPKEILGFLDNLIGGGNHSQGYAQIQPETAKEYNIALTDLYTMEGSFNAAYKILSSNYNIAKNYYNGDFVTKFDNGKSINEQWVYQPNKKGGYTLISGPYKGIEAKELFPSYSEKQYPKELDKNKNPIGTNISPVFTMSTPKLQKEKALGNDAALHMAVVAHNAGTGILGKWCETNMPNIANKCNQKQRNPYNDNRVAITDTSKPIPNYFPNKGGSHNYIPQFRKSFDNLQGITKYF